MERKVSSTGVRGKAKMEVHRVVVDKMKNGFTVKVHKRTAPGTSREAMMSMPMEDEEGPAVFTKHAPAHAAVKAAMMEMHPSLPPAGGDDAGPPQVPPPGQPASATEPS